MSEAYISSALALHLVLSWSDVALVVNSFVVLHQLVVCRKLSYLVLSLLDAY